jgi:sugar phosphate isomerase/epimerase
MKKGITRRQFVGASAGVGCAATLLAPTAGLGLARAAEIDKPALRIGLMTYRLGQDWDVDTIIKNCREAQWEHAELRTTHGHGVEVGLSKAQRRDVRKKFEDAGIKLSLASAFAYHWPDAEKVRENVEGTKKYTLLARDIGARGIRVFPQTRWQSCR